jgi:retinol dehydrogenase-16
MSGCFCVGCLVIAVAIYKTLDWLLRRFYLGDNAKRYILVTGCDTGFGNILAKRLDSLGCHVYAGCLTEGGRADLSKACSSNLLPLAMDVSKPDSIRQALDVVKSKLPPGKGLWGVLNNAGIFGPLGPPEWMTVDDYKAVAAVNLYGLIDVTMTFLPLVKMARGRVVNTSSLFGRLAGADYAPYCVTKYGVEAFTDGLRRSLHPFGVRAALIEPAGFTNTTLLTRANLERSFSGAWNQATPEVKAEFGEEYFKTLVDQTYDLYSKGGNTRPDDVVDAYVHALLGRYTRARYVVGADAQYFWVPALTLLPEWAIDRVLGHFFDCKQPPAALAEAKKRQ